MIDRSHAAALVALLVVVSTVAAPAAGQVLGDSDGDQITYGADSVPSWHVHFSDGGLDALESWTNSSESRSLLQTHNESGYALVSAPRGDAGVGLLAGAFRSGLQQRGYVTDIRPNLQHSLAEPVTLANASDVDHVPSGWRATIAGFGADYDADGIAFQQDANESTLADVRDVTGVANVSATGEGATIAVIDSGVNTADGVVFGNGSDGSDVRILPASKDYIQNETVREDGLDAVDDPAGHGSWVASAAAANASGTAYDGMAPDADVLALRTLDADGSGSAGHISQAIRYAADEGADSIVMSLGSPFYDTELADALDYAVEQNVTAISIAVGNSRVETRWLNSPADADVQGVTAVAATNTSSNATAASAYFSNIGPDPGTTDASGGASAGQRVDVAAPGMNVTAEVPTTAGSTSEQTLSGTSMAAPHVAGIAALGVEVNEPWVGDAAAFDANVTTTARPMPRAAQVEVGGGMVAADRLLDGETGGSQASAMNASAEARDDFWRSLSQSTDWLSLPTFLN